MQRLVSSKIQGLNKGIGGERDRSESFRVLHSVFTPPPTGLPGESRIGLPSFRPRRDRRSPGSGNRISRRLFGRSSTSHGFSQSIGSPRRGGEAPAGFVRASDGASACLVMNAKKAESNGAKIINGVKVTGFKKGSNSNAITGVETDKGVIDCEQVVVGVGPWVRDIWSMLELPEVAKIKGQDGKIHETPMWKYWFLQEGVIGVDKDFLKTNDGKAPPVTHVDSTAPLYSDHDGKLITDKIWGIYYKPDIEGLGVQGGTSPYIVDKHFNEVAVDPYGLESKEYQTTDKFSEMWCSALAHCQKRFEGKSGVYRKGPSGGLGCMTPDSFPIFDKFCQNVYIIADANHGYKMIGVGELVAKEITGTESELLKPFRFNRYEKGEMHPTSNSPFPWS